MSAFDIWSASLNTRKIRVDTCYLKGWEWTISLLKFQSDVVDRALSKAGTGLPLLGSALILGAVPSAHPVQELCPAGSGRGMAYVPWGSSALGSYRHPSWCWLPRLCHISFNQQSGHSLTDIYLIYSSKSSDREIWLSCNWKSSLQSHHCLWNLWLQSACPSEGRGSSRWMLITILFGVGNTVITPSARLLLLWPFLIGDIFLNVSLLLLSLFSISLIAFLSYKLDVVSTEGCTDCSPLSCMSFSCYHVVVIYLPFHTVFQ